jgi:hypothetical protein
MPASTDLGRKRLTSSMSASETLTPVDNGVFAIDHKIRVRVVVPGLPQPTSDVDVQRETAKQRDRKQYQQRSEGDQENGQTERDQHGQPNRPRGGRAL